MKSYRFKKFSLLLFFIMYTLVQCAGQATSPRGEFFPVFSWSLFSGVQNPRFELEIEILRIGEAELPAPINFFELGEYFRAARSRSSDVVKSAHRVFRQHRKDPISAEHARRMFEQTFLGDQGAVEYQFVLLSFDPVVRWRTGEVVERRVVARFSTEQAQ